MAALVPPDRGQGPDVVLLHGVGVGPESFARVAELLGADHRVVAPGRPVGPGGAALPLSEQADVLARTLEDLGAAGCRLVGVSGGATLGLCLAIRHPALIGSMVLHEPLVGPLAPDLHARFQASAARASASDAAAMEVVRAVMGDPTWRALGAEGRAASEDLAPRWRGEVAQFAAFAPSAAELEAIGTLPLLVTVGERSGPERWAAAQVLVRCSGARATRIPAAGNAVQLDAPDAFAALISTTQPVSTGGAP
jgi:pimeloyl-ACP methyl ester carboxylesterase